MKLTLKIERPAYGGISIARHDGKIVMIKGAVLPGETAEVVVDEEKKDYLKASVTKVLERSPERIEPACEFFGMCGGCQLQHMSYEHQVRMKENILSDCLQRAAKIDLPLSDTLINNVQWNYRIRGQFKVAEGKTGFYKEGTRELVPITSCPVMTKEVNENLVIAEGLLKDTDFHEIHITCGAPPVILLKIRGKVKPWFEKIALGFIKAGAGSVFIETTGRKIFRYGVPYTTVNLAGLNYTVSPMSFLQGNWALNQSVVKLIKDELQPLKNLTLLDLYSGAGNFSLPLAEDADVTAVEENSYAVNDGKRNLKINRISSIRFVRSTAEKFQTKEHYDIVLLDPPRPGLTKRAMNNVLSIKPERIVYISCNPTTFARDLKILSLTYNIRSVRMIDLFPQTYHIESLAFLELR